MDLSERNHRSYRAVVGSLLLLLLAVPPATWWIVGDQSEIEDPYYADYLVEPPDISSTTEAVVGSIGLLLVVGALAVALPHLRNQRQWIPVFAAVAAAGALFGYGGRVVTAGGSGANIGGSLLLYFGGPTYLALLWSAFVRSRRLSRQGPEDQPRL